MIDKEINDACNDYKGHGKTCAVFCERHFPGRVKVPITRVLGGARFDVAFEACVGNYWKRPEIMKWLFLVLPLPKNGNVMQQALYIILRSSEMIAQLRVGAIFFLAVIVPLRWLSAKTHLLAHWKWDEKHMASAFDCVYKKCLLIKQRPKLILQKSFMMSIFSKLYKKLPELKEYLDWSRGEQKNKIHGCNAKESRICGVEMVIDELFYPKLASNKNTYDICLDLGDELAERMLVEYQDESKVMHFYINDLGGKYSMSKTSRKEKEDGYGIVPNNDASERNFAIFRDALQHMGNASIYRAAAEAQSRMNNDYGRNINALVSGRSSKVVSCIMFLLNSLLL